MIFTITHTGFKCSGAYLEFKGGRGEGEVGIDPAHLGRAKENADQTLDGAPQVGHHKLLHRGWRARSDGARELVAVPDAHAFHLCLERRNNAIQQQHIWKSKEFGHPPKSE